MTIDRPTLRGACIWAALLGFTAVLWTLAYVVCRWLLAGT